MKHEGVGFQVYISIPDHFPEEQPLIALQRVEGASAESATFQQYAWSPRWPAKEMARRIYAFLQVKTVVSDQQLLCSLSRVF
jgi:hypothetical protein